jgi:hypothetical protein
MSTKKARKQSKQSVTDETRSNHRNATSSRTMTSAWDLEDLRVKFAKYVIGNCWLKVANLKPGSKMRRRGEGGIRSWQDRLAGKGITNSAYAFHAFLGSDNQEDSFDALVAERLSVIEKAGLTAPRKGVEFEQLDFSGFLMDGAHRNTALERLAEACALSVAGGEEKKFYEWVPVIIYSRAIIPDVCIVSKVINDTGCMGVPEDALEVITFTQSVCAMYLKKEHELALRANNKWVAKKELKDQKPPTVSLMTEYLMLQRGRGSKATKASKGYARQLVQAATNAKGPMTTHITVLLDLAEKRYADVGSPSLFLLVPNSPQNLIVESYSVK